MKSIVDFLVVGTAPLGSALRAAVMGAVAVSLGRMFFAGWWLPLLFGVCACVVILPLAYMISSRDDGEDIDPYLAAQDETPPAPGPRDVHSDPK